VSAPKRSGRAPKRFIDTDPVTEETLLRNLLVQVRQQAGTLDRLEAKLDTLIKATTALPLVKNKRRRK
jgi:hypothetical protein